MRTTALKTVSNLLKAMMDYFGIAVVLETTRRLQDWLREVEVLFV